MVQPTKHAPGVIAIPLTTPGTITTNSTSYTTTSPTYTHPHRNGNSRTEKETIQRVMAECVGSLRQGTIPDNSQSKNKGCEHQDTGYKISLTETLVQSGQRRTLLQPKDDQANNHL